jgi:hypothetical protein
MRDELRHRSDGDALALLFKIASAPEFASRSPWSRSAHSRSSRVTRPTDMQMTAELDAPTSIR